MGRAFTAALFAVLAPGCFAARSVPPPVSQALPSANQLLTSLEHRRDRLQGVRALARLRYRSPAGVESARNALAVQRPDRLRIEVLSVLGSMFVLTSDDGMFSAYVPSESKFYRGTASPANLAPYLPAGITVPVIVDHILATPPVHADGPAAVEWDQGMIRLTQHDDRGSRTVWFRDLETAVNYREIDAQGRTTIEVTYDEIDDSVALPVTTRVTVRFPLTGESLEISMREPEINPQLPAEYFSMTAPAEARQIDLDNAQF